ncbi:hypothetical protein HY008_00260 [Candidatus Woesebacteria bacterium]|nr:hypothetical protein [Candidatus Woesebacteria bacterium]
MKSITIHNLDNSLDILIREQARRQGTSLNRTIKKLLKESLGIAPDEVKKRQVEFRDIFATWSKKDEKEFNFKAKFFEKVDSEDWL